MKKISFALLLLASILLTACSGSRTTVASGWAGLTADETQVYLAYNNFVYAIDPTNGSERWRYPKDADPALTFYAPPAVTTDGQVIIGGYNHNLYALDAESGQENWVFPIPEGRFIGGPLVTEAGIFAAATDGKVYAITPAGEQLWAPFATEKEIWAAPVSDKDCECLYIASMDHRVYALDARSGNLLWKTDDLGGAIVSSPAIDDGSLYVGTFGRQVVALDASDGSEKWRFDTQEWVWGTPALDENNLYVGDLSGTLYALNKADGSLLWKVQPGGAIVDHPLVTAEGIYFTSEDGLVVSLTPEGSIRWQQTLEGHTYTAPLAFEGMILVATDQPDALLAALDSNGVGKWVFANTKE